MKTSESITKISPAFLRAQIAIGKAAKSSTNPHFKSKYSDLETVIDAVKRPLNEAGIAFLQSSTNDSTGVSVCTRFQHESGEFMEDSIYLPVPQQTPQAYGSAITYGKRYQLQSMTGLPSADDDGAEASKAKPAETPRPNTAKQVAVDAFNDLPPDQQKRAHQHATAIIDLCDNREPMVAYKESHITDTEMELAVWSLLPSKVRTLYKKEQAELAKANPRKFTPQDYASQP